MLENWTLLRFFSSRRMHFMCSPAFRGFQETDCHSRSAIFEVLHSNHFSPLFGTGISDEIPEGNRQQYFHAAVIRAPLRAEI